MKPVNRSKWLLGLLFFVFSLMLIRLFILRFEVGDIYPPYSSFRADPLGTRVLYEALSRIKPSKVVRNFKPSDQIKDLQNTCILVAGIAERDIRYVTRRSYEEMMQLVHNGNRLVVALKPGSIQKRRSKATPSSETEQQDKPSDKKPVPNKENKDPDAPEYINLMDQWGLSIRNGRLPSEGQQAVVSEEMTQGSRMDSILWMRQLYFVDDSLQWKPVYQVRGQQPVIMERAFGKGSVVIMADSYALSNECLKQSPNAGFLSWLISRNEYVMFDEYHLGIQKHQGISDLFVKYGLYGPVISILVLLILFFWRSVQSLVPPDEDEELMLLEQENQRLSLTRDHVSGLTSLLKQNIAKKELINQCLVAWKTSFVVENEASQTYRKQYERIKTAIPARKSTLDFREREVEHYKDICRILTQKETL